MKQAPNFSCVALYEGSCVKMALIRLSGEILYSSSALITDSFELFLSRMSGELLDDMLLQAKLPKSGLKGLGVILPGVCSEKSLMLDRAPSIGVNEPVCLAKWGEDVFAKHRIPVFIENDANAHCIGEHKARAQDNLVYITIGSGVGAGIMLDGKLRRGEGNRCGEIGYNIFFEENRRLQRNKGKLENRISYPALCGLFALERYSSPAQIPHPVLRQITQHISTPLAICIANIVHLLDCSTIVVGGMVPDMLGQELYDAVAEQLDSICISPLKLLKPSFDSVGLTGMAYKIACGLQSSETF